MPTYEYACKKCGEQFDVVQSFDDEPLKRHKGCGGAVRRVFGSVGIAFKGSGFYKNDSRSSSGASKSKTESSTSESPAAPAPATEKTEKPAPAKDTKDTKVEKKPATTTT